jgi:hypothetical protein
VLVATQTFTFGEEALSQGYEGSAVFGALRACADAPIQMRRALVAQAWPRTRRC